jgi:hypothetical protein
MVAKNTEGNFFFFLIKTKYRMYKVVQLSKETPLVYFVFSKISRHNALPFLNATVNYPL